VKAKGNQSGKQSEQKNEEGHALPGRLCSGLEKKIFQGSHKPTKDGRGKKKGNRNPTTT